jgi:hypothetical protein
MRRLIIISALCLAVILVGAIYTLIDGIICGSYLGIILSLTCIQLCLWAFATLEKWYNKQRKKNLTKGNFYTT